MSRTIRRCAGLLPLLMALAATPSAAQSLLDRPPNVHGDWVGTSGRLYFNFLHRFSASAPPARKVGNVPTFMVALGLPARTLVGAHYATNSQLAPAYPNEWELFARHQAFAQAAGAPLDVGGQVGYNLASEGVDGEVSLARRQGLVRGIVAARILADPFVAGQTRFAAAVGATARLSRHFALAADVASLLNPGPDERLAWSAGVHVALPHTPHTLSLHAANTNAATLQGLSRGEERVRYGFEFTVPFTLQRWLGGGGSRPPPPVAGAPDTSRASSTEESTNGAERTAAIRDFAFGAPIEVAAGTTIVWKNDDPVAHTVTAEDGGFDSGAIEPGGTWRRTFREPGSYPFLCAPHPFMKGVVVVR